MASVRMPILASGSFSVQVSGPENAFVKNKVTVFSFKPLFLVAVFFFSAAALGVYLIYRRGEKYYSLARLLVLLPGLVGIVLPYGFGIAEIGPISITILQRVTVLFVLWKLFRVKNFWLLHLVGYAALVIVMWGNLFLSLSCDALELIPSCLLYGALYYLSCFLFLLLNRRRRSLKRWFGGLFLGLLVPGIGVAAYILISYGSMRSAILNGLLFLVLFLVPFALLVRWNAWAGDIVSGDIYELIQNQGNDIESSKQESVVHE